MDAKPQRSVRALAALLPNDENDISAKQSLHQRHKSVGNLKSTGLGLAQVGIAKRTVFGDVSNNARTIVDVGSKELAKTRVSVPTREDVAIDKENGSYAAGEAFLRPAQRVTALGSKPLSNASSQYAKVVVSADSQAQSLVKTGAVKKATLVYQDYVALEPQLPAIVAEQIEDFAPSLDKVIKSPRHFRSQPSLRPEQPILRRTQSRYLPKSEPPSSIDDDVTEALYEDAVEELLKPTAEPTYPQELSVIHEAPSREPYGLDVKVPYTGPRLSDSEYRLPSLCDLEDYWDEEEDEEDLYEDQAYTTAHSYRSHGDNTTGGATTLMAPKVTAKVQRELDQAKIFVESNMTEDDREEDAWDVSMVAEYGEEIFQYMRTMETNMLPNPHYMDIQTEIQWSMRSVLMDWLVQVHHRFGLLPETLFLTVNYIDRFLSVKVVSLGKLQLVGATAIFVAAKYEEINCPSVQEVVFMVDNGYTVEEILKAERFMLSMLAFELGWPGPMSFLRRISKADEYDLETRTLAKYFLEVTIMDERFVGSPPSFTAAGAHCLARLMLKKGEWTPAHSHYAGYTWSQLRHLVATILECCQQPVKHHEAVYEKYASSKYKRASVFVKEEIEKGFTLPRSNLRLSGMDENVVDGPELGAKMFMPFDG